MTWKNILQRSVIIFRSLKQNKQNQNQLGELVNS